MRHLPSGIHHRLRASGLFLASIIALVACQSAASATPAASPTAAAVTESLAPPSSDVPPTQTTTPTPTETPGPTETPAPTSSPTPSPTSTRIPFTTEDFPLNHKGPLLLFLSGQSKDGACNGARYLWATSQDGTWLTKLDDKPVLTFDVRPGSTAEGGAVVAYVTNTSLRIMELPSGKVKTITPILGEGVKLPNTWDNNLGASIVNDGLKWSPGGETLAFVAGLKDNAANVFAYDYASGAITRLSDQPGLASDLNWSPDGGYVVYAANSGALEGRVRNMWAVRPDGTGTRPLFGETGTHGYAHVVGWLGQTRVVVDNWYLGSVADIRVVDAGTGDTTTVFDEAFLGEAFSAERNTWLVIPSGKSNSDASLVMIRDGSQTKLPGHHIQRVWWSREYDMFFGGTEDGTVYSITLGGQITPLSISPMGDSSYTFIPSPDRKWWAWSINSIMRPGISVGAPWSQPGFVGIGFNSAWSPDSQHLIALTQYGLFVLEPPDFQASRLLLVLCDDYLSETPYGFRYWWAAWIQ